MGCAVAIGAGPVDSRRHKWAGEREGSGKLAKLGQNGSSCAATTVAPPSQHPDEDLSTLCADSCSMRASSAGGQSSCTGLRFGAVRIDSDVPFVPRSLTGDERDKAWQGANFYGATGGHEQPVALWILGPSSVGKSTLTLQAAPSFGIEQVPPAPPPLCLEAAADPAAPMPPHLDAVVVDGEFMRKEHAMWQAWVASPYWASAYPAMKGIINAEKDRMLEEASLQRKHLVIPQTCLNLGKNLEEVRELRRAGYTNHVFAIVAPLAECQRRGSAREAKTGKRYQAGEYEQSIGAIPQLIAACNGRYEVVRVRELPGGDDDAKAARCEDRMRCELLVDGQCAADEPGFPGQFNDESLRALIEGAIRG